MKLNVVITAIPDVLVIEPTVFSDDRGFFFESFNAEAFKQATGVKQAFVQDNHSRSKRNVLRGLHYQVQNPQGKLVRVAIGEIFDVAVDIRKSSPTFGKWVGVVLSEKNKRQLWVPEGFAHGFLTLSESADVLYKTTDYWNPLGERSIRWDDPSIGIEWPIEDAPIVSVKDEAGASLASSEIEIFA
jgi:dTDP-4-dehydrorhamnose 3,5-epimerase